MANFTLEYTEPIVLGDPQHSRVSLKNLVLPVTWYNVVQGDTMTFQSVSAELNIISLVPGAYTATTLALMMTAAMSAAGVTINSSTCTYNPTSLCFTWQMGPQAQRIIGTLISSRLLRLFGLPAAGTGAVFVTAYASPAPAMEVRDNLLSIQVDCLDNQESTVSNGQLLRAAFRLPRTANSGEVLVYDPAGQNGMDQRTQWVRPIHEKVKRISVRLMDEDGNDLPLLTDWSFSLMVSREHQACKRCDHKKHGN
ncbi:MAG: hypothetical protein WC829_16885 [Hyphomicrobium sp.]|jgi:hypothetical protein